MDSSCMNTHVSSNMLAKTKASLIERRKSENVGAKSWKAELRLKKELMSPQKPRSCPTTLHYRAFGDFPGTQNSCQRTNPSSSFRIFCSLRKVLLVYHDFYWMMEHGRRRKWCKKRTISWLMKQELTWDKAFRESTHLLHLFLIYLSICGFSSYVGSKHTVFLRFFCYNCSHQ